MGVTVTGTIKPFAGIARRREQNIAKSEEQMKAAIKMKQALHIPLTQQDYEQMAGGAMGAALYQQAGSKPWETQQKIAEEEAEKELQRQIRLKKAGVQPKTPTAPKTFTVNKNGKTITYERTYDESSGKWTTKELGSSPQWKPDEGKSEDDKVLSPSDAEKLGVPFGTTAGEAASLSISPMSTSSRKELTAFNPARAIVNKIDELSKKIITAEGATGAAMQGVGNVWGSLTKSNPDAVMYDKMKEGLISLLTRAMGEKGVLTNEDINRVRQLLPTFRDTAEVRERSISELNSLIDEFEERTKAALTTPITTKETKKPDPLGIR